MQEDYPQQPHNSGITIEVCVDSVESALAAVRGGADRLELCGNLGLGGGTTPSLGLLKSVQEAVPRRIPIMAMVRPRTGDFLYSDTEFNVMLEDVRFFKASGTAGVALGVLDQSGRVDVDRTRKLVDEAFPMQVCFHRAFDMTRDPLEALRDISTIPRVTRILTSGHGPIAPSSLHVLRTLFGTASATVPHAPAVLPGSGISPATARQLLDALLPCGLKEIHLSAGAWEPGAMVYRRHGMGMGAGGEGEWGVWRASEERVRAVRTIADEALREYYATVEKTVAGMADS